MKKVPSYPKITAKTNITVTQTQNININSPKGIPVKKVFKRDSKKTKNNQQLLKNQHQNFVINEARKINQANNKKSSKKISSNEHKPLEKQKILKNSKSQRQLEVLSDKLKKLELKIKILKAQQKQKKSKLGSSSNRSFSKNRQSREHSGFMKKQPQSSKKIKKQFKIYQRSESSKMLKKSYSDKLGLKLSSKHGEQMSKKKKMQNDQDNNGCQKMEAQVLHRFVTQVPNKNPHARNSPLDLKASIQKSLRKKTYQLSIDQNSQSFEEARMEVIENYPQFQSTHYYIQRCYHSLKDPCLLQYRDHLAQSLQTLHFLEKVRKPSLKQLEKHSLVLGPLGTGLSASVKANKETGIFTVVLDLDETLIHCNETLHDPYDVKLNIKFPTGEKIDAGVNIRPYAQQFLKQLAQICEVVVFTASHQCYANVVLDYLDPHKNLVSYRMFRQHCWQTQQGIYIKDLRALKNRSLQKVILVDNAAYSYYYQLQNGIPIVPFYDDQTDNQLKVLLVYIKKLIATASASNNPTTDTLRRLNDKYFRLKEYVSYQDVQILTDNLYRNYKNNFTIDNRDQHNSHNNFMLGMENECN